MPQTRVRMFIRRECRTKLKDVMIHSSFHPRQDRRDGRNNWVCSSGSARATTSAEMPALWRYRCEISKSDNEKIEDYDN